MLWSNASLIFYESEEKRMIKLFGRVKLGTGAGLSALTSDLKRKPIPPG